ncbi:MAG TPA: hypothetical protein VNK96_00425 [Fimbriimonadales bacterium]|nr:hypothetical protein [Fimbriimonadales bacterium]
MEATLLIAALMQIALLGALLYLHLQLLQKVERNADKLEELLSNATQMLRDEVRPALSEARQAIRSVETAAKEASETLKSAEPVIKTVSQVLGVFQKPASPVWLDAIRLGIRVALSLREKVKSKQMQEPHRNDEPIVEMSEAIKNPTIEK